MFKRSFISIFKNKTRTIILAVLLFVVANLVLASISIKSATEEAMDLARISLGPEITLTTNRTELTDFIRSYRDTYGTRPSSEIINEMLLPIESTLAFDLASSEYVIDFNFSSTLNATPVDFSGLIAVDTLDTVGDVKINLTGTYNPYLLDQFGDYGTYELTVDSSGFTGDQSNVIVITESLAYLNNLALGDSITLTYTDAITMVSYTITPTIVGFFNDTSTLISSSSKISENEMYLPLVDLLALQGLTEEDAFTITTAKYYLDDPLNINDFVVDATSSYTEISSGQLTFNDVNYDAIVEPIQNVSDFADIFLISVSIGSVVILSLLIFNALKDRKYEIGVLLSLGEEKIKIIMQYIVELLVIASMVFLLSAFSSNFISAQVGDMLIQNEITELDEQTSETTQTPKGGGGSLSIVTLENLEYVDELNVNVTFNDFIITLGIGFAIIIVSSAIPSFYITRYNPKTILSSRN